MAADDLSSITGMEDKHRRALARRQITTLRGLAAADQHVIYRAMGNIKPRPTLSQIAQWQSQARSRLDEPRGEDKARSGDQARSEPEEARSEPDEAGGRPDEAQSQRGKAAADTGEWQPVASFAVVFMRRQAGGTWERRVEAERTEVEREREREVWPGWECNPLCGWMLGQLGQADGGPGQPDQARGGQPEPAGEPTGAARPRGARPQLRIDSAPITDAAGSFGLVTDGAPVADPPTELIAPARVVFTVSGARRGTGGTGGGAAPRSRRAGQQRGRSGGRSAVGPGRLRPVPGRG